METPGFTWRVSVTIFVVFAWMIFLVIWLLFYATDYSAYQNLAIIFVSILVGLAFLAASWASWGIRYGFMYKDYWSGYEGRQARRAKRR